MNELLMKVNNKHIRDSSAQNNNEATIDNAEINAKK